MPVVKVKLSASLILIVAVLSIVATDETPFSIFTVFVLVILFALNPLIMVADLLFVKS